MAFLGNRPDAFQYGSTAYQSLSGDGVTTTFTLSRQVSANSDIQVTVNNVLQEPSVAYYVTNLTNLIFTAAPSAAANNIYIVYRQFVQSGIAPGANTVTTSAIAANTIQPWQLTNSLLNPVVNTFTGTGANTVYTLAFTPPSSNSVVVSINGITQNSPANYSTNGSTLTFTDPPALNSVIRVMQQAVIGTSIVPVDGSVGNSKLASNLTLTGDTTLTGNLSVGGTTTFTGGLNIDSNTLVVDGVNNRVGIGTATPSFPFHLVSSQVNAAVIQYADDGAGYGPALALRRTSTTPAASDGLGYLLFQGQDSAGATTNYAGIYGEISDPTDTSEDGNLLFFTNQAGSFAQRMIVTNIGNVGIGTASPANKLDVNGGANFGGTISTGNGVSTGDCNIELGALRTGSGPSYIDFHSVAGTDYESRIIRASGANGALQIINAGTGDFRLQASGAAPMIFDTSGTERMRIDSSGNVGIGTSSPTQKISVLAASTESAFLSLRGNNNDSTSELLIGQSGTSDVAYVYNRANGVLVFGTNNIERGRFDTSGNFQFNSGYGSVATAYGCRAWVNFNGSGVVAIRDSGNVSSITDNGTGNYTVNFTAAMPDADYAVTGAIRTNATTSTGSLAVYPGATPTTTAVQIYLSNCAAASQAAFDAVYAYAAFFR